MKITLHLTLHDENDHSRGSAVATIPITDRMYEYRAIHDDICAVTWDMMRRVIDNQEASTDISPADMLDDHRVELPVYNDNPGDLT